ncbi:hypothetical protein [Sphaerisporangium sp. NPDC051011]
MTDVMLGITFAGSDASRFIGGAYPLTTIVDLLQDLDLQKR